MESRDLVVDQVLVEYQAYCTGQLSERLGTTEAPDGAVEYCGDEDDPAYWAICYVRASDGVVRPLVVGQRAQVLTEFRAMDRRGMPFWDAHLFPPPVAVIGGHEYPFKAARGRHLLGVVRLERQAVLLAAADDRLVAVLLADGVATPFPLGRPQALREVDIDLLRAFSRPTTAATTKPPDDPLRPSPRTKAHHIRIVPGRKVELGDGPTVAEVLKAAFADIEARATTPPTKSPRGKQTAAAGKAASPAAATKRPTLIGKRAAPLVLEYLRRMALRGCGDLVGLTGDIIRAIQALCEDFKITSEAFADALKRIASTGTCLIGPRESGDRIWEIKLAGLNDPTSAHHIRLCRETRSRVRLKEAAANQRAAAGERAVPADTQASPVAAKAEGPISSGQAGEPSAAAPGDAADTNNANERTSAGERRSTPPDPAVHAQDSGTSAGPAPSATTASAHDPTTETATAAQDDALDLAAQLGMNPIGGFMFLLWCLMQMPGSSAPGARDDAAGVENTEPRAESEPRPTAANDGAVHIECTSPGDDAAIAVAAVVQDDESTPHEDDSRRNDSEMGRVDEVPATAAGVLTLPSQQDVIRRASLLKAPPLHRQHAFAPVQPEPRCSDLGTLGPRGPPRTRSG